MYWFVFCYGMLRNEIVWSVDLDWGSYVVGCGFGRRILYDWPHVTPLCSTSLYLASQTSYKELASPVVKGHVQLLPSSHTYLLELSHRDFQTPEALCIGSRSSSDTESNILSIRSHWKHYSALLISSSDTENTIIYQEAFQILKALYIHYQKLLNNWEYLHWWRYRSRH